MSCYTVLHSRGQKVPQVRKELQVTGDQRVMMVLMATLEGVVDREMMGRRGRRENLERMVTLECK